MAATTISILPAVVDCLVEKWIDRPALNGVRIDVPAPAGDDRATELVFLDDIDDWQIEHKVISGRSTVARDEDGRLPWVIEVRSKVRAQDSLERAFVILNELLLEIATDPRLGGAVDGLTVITADTVRVELKQNERKPLTKITVNLRVRGKLR